MTPSLVKVVAGGGEAPEHGAQVLETSREDMHDPALALHFALHGHEARSEQLAALPIGKVVPDDEVHVARLVLQGHEDYAARRGRTLTACNDAGGADELAMARGRHLFRCSD